MKHIKSTVLCLAPEIVAIKNTYVLLNFSALSVSSFPKAPLGKSICFENCVRDSSGIFWSDSNMDFKNGWGSA